MKITFTCSDCPATVTREYRGGRKRIRCTECAKKTNLRKAAERKKRMRGKSHDKKAAPSIPYRHFHPEEEDRLKTIPPAERARIALERKTEGWTPEHRAAFINGPAGKQFREVYL